MSIQSDYTKPKVFTKNWMMSLPEETANLLKYVSAWEKKTMTQMVRARIDDLLADWKERNPEKYELWRQQYENSRD